MLATDSASANQQGQLTPDQRASIGRWLAGYQMRAIPSLMPLVVVVGLGLLLLPRLSPGVRGADSAPVVWIVAVAVVLVADLYAVTAVRRIIALGSTRSGLIAPRVQQVSGTVVCHGEEQMAVMTDGRTWNLGNHPNVSREARTLTAGAYVFYTLPVSVPRDGREIGGDGAWLLAALRVETSSSDPTLTLMQTLAATNGFSLSALRDNRAGHLSTRQVDSLAETFRRKTWLRVWLGVAAIGFGAIAWFPTTSQDENERWIGIALALVGVAVVLYNLGPGRARQAADLTHAEVVHYPGPVSAVRTLSNDGGQLFYYELAPSSFVSANPRSKPSTSATVIGCTTCPAHEHW